MATTGPDAPLPPAEAVAVFDRFKANLAHVAAVRPAELNAREAAERDETTTSGSGKPQK